MNRTTSEMRKSGLNNGLGDVLSRALQDVYKDGWLGCVSCLRRVNNANLQGANLTEAKELTQMQLDQACGDTETKLPEGLTIATCR